MIEPKKTYTYNIGTTIILDCGIDISDATVFKMIVKKPDGRIENWQPIKDNLNKNILKFTAIGNGAPGYQRCGLTIINDTDPCGLNIDTLYSIKINNNIFIIDTKDMIDPISFSDLITLLNNYFTENDINMIASLIEIEVDEVVTHKDLQFTSTLVGKDAYIQLELLNNEFCLIENLTDFIALEEEVKPIVASFDIHGRYLLQSYIEIGNPATFKGYGETVELEIFKQFE